MRIETRKKVNNCIRKVIGHQHLFVQKKTVNVAFKYKCLRKNSTSFTLNPSDTAYLLIYLFYEPSGTSSRSVVVITCASHAQGPQFDPGREHEFLFTFLNALVL